MNKENHPKSYLEYNELPVLELAKLAQREGRRPRPIYTAHKWFARRLGVIFRALLVGATCSPEDDFWDSYYAGIDLKKYCVLDPFVGGGTSVVEAQRLGASVVGVDIDPVACTITQMELTAASIPDLSDALEHLQRKVGSRLRQYHTFRLPSGEEHQVVHHFWVQVVTCQQCGESFDAHPNFQLARDNKHQWVFCEKCGHIETRRPKHKTFRCGNCKHRTSINNGPVNYGRVTCPSCEFSQSLIEIGRSTLAPPQWRQFAVEVLLKPEGNRPIPMAQRTFFAATEESDRLYQSAVEDYELHQGTHPHTLPNDFITSENRADSRLIDYGYRQWTDLFNKRQLLHFSMLTEEILSFPEPTRAALAMAFSDHLTTNCMLTSYAAGWRRLTPLFSIRAFRHVPRPVELNPWLNRSGRGTFPNTVRKLMRAKDFIVRPKEPCLKGGFHPVQSYVPEHPAKVHCGTARNLTLLPNNSIDIVLTDPPYFDNIAYSELAEFFLPWLALLGVITEDHTLNQIMTESLIGDRTSTKSITQYTNNLSDAFAEIARVLKPTGILIFSYRHSLPQAWLALANAIAPHALEPIKTLPVPGEAGMGLHNQNGTGLWDAVFIMRKSKEGTRNQNCLILTQDEKAQVVSFTNTWAKKLKNAPLPFKNADKTTLTRAAIIMKALSQKTPATSQNNISELEQILMEIY